MKYRKIGWSHYDSLGKSLGSFNLKYRWGITGKNGDGSYKTFEADIPTESAEEAEKIILDSFEVTPKEINWRYNSLKEGGPFKEFIIDLESQHYFKDNEE